MFSSLLSLFLFFFYLAVLDENRAQKSFPLVGPSKPDHLLCESARMTGAENKLRNRWRFYDLLLVSIRLGQIV